MMMEVGVLVRFWGFVRTCSRGPGVWFVDFLRVCALCWFSWGVGTGFLFLGAVRPSRNVD